eukprot:TRINITY_DN3332_c1_g1_i1.p4 TRINITY_DN3332_c1_g1~~TRINITY_DN3332_c1_g1_i1.p4  ORF type:complete len:54 (-),score=2.76 TRINITY_DN3332_c1_g1_i1:91-252(-)
MEIIESRYKIEKCFLHLAEICDMRSQEIVTCNICNAVVLVLCFGLVAIGLLVV